jgi:tRNA 5-methylaminomethyl-2-thiouridine biosynthesis bifunctional protein
MKRIAHPQIDFKAEAVPQATAFGDIYFSPEDGLAETELVFLQGNNLPHAWQGQDRFTIAETGFGTGLNFLATVRMFEQNPGQCRHLHYISTERYPLSLVQLTEVLKAWAAHRLDTERLLQVYPLRIPGFHRIWFAPNITLTLIFDDVLKAFNELDASVDTWFLDGFAPAKNPEMWTDDLYRAMAGLSHSQTTIASFTAAGAVRRGLQEAGFSVTRVSGFANKRHRITGVFQGGEKTAVTKPQSVAIIGAGLSGATLAQSLQRHGLTCTIFDAASGPGQNASSNRLGLINPKLDVGHADLNDLGQSIYSFALHRIKDTADISFKQNGALHLAQDAVKRQKQLKIAEQLDWLPEHIELRDDAVFYNDAATVDTAALVENLLSGCDVRWNSSITDLTDLSAQFDRIIVASAEAAITLYPEWANILQPMRGQVTFLQAPSLLSHPIVAGHYVTQVDEDTWVTGATFQRQRTDKDPDPKDDRENMAALRRLIPGLPDELQITGHWAQIRYTTPDRRPVLGQISDNIWLSTALGSHGLQYSFMLAEVLASQWAGAPRPVAKNVLKCLDLQRYYRDPS